MVQLTAHTRLSWLFTCTQTQVLDKLLFTPTLSIHIIQYTTALCNSSSLALCMSIVMQKALCMHLKTCSNLTINDRILHWLLMAILSSTVAPAACGTEYSSACHLARCQQHGETWSEPSPPSTLVCQQPKQDHNISPTQASVHFKLGTMEHLIKVSGVTETLSLFWWIKS